MEEGERRMEEGGMDGGFYLDFGGEKGYHSHVQIGRKPYTVF